VKVNLGMMDPATLMAFNKLGVFMVLIFWLFVDVLLLGAACGVYSALA
jgi:hypothetical protein